MFGFWYYFVTLNFHRNLSGSLMKRLSKSDPRTSQQKDPQTSMGPKSSRLAIRRSGSQTEQNSRRAVRSKLHLLERNAWGAFKQQHAT